MYGKMTLTKDTPMIDWAGETHRGLHPAITFKAGEEVSVRVERIREGKVYTVFTVHAGTVYSNTRLVDRRGTIFPRYNFRVYHGKVTADMCYTI